MRKQQSNSAAAQRTGEDGARASGWGRLRVGWIVMGVAIASGSASGAGEDPFELVWGVHIGGAGSELAEAVCVDGDGNVLTAGTAFGELFGPFAGARDAFVAKHDANGNLLWGRQFGTTALDRATAVGVDGAGNVYTAGYSGGALFPSSPAGMTAFLAKHDADGNLVWGRQVGPVDLLEPIGLAVDGNAVYITGAAGFDAMLTKFDLEGDLLWQRRFGTGDAQLGASVATDGLGAVYICGLVIEAMSFDALLVKYSSSGSVLWSRRFDSGANDAADAVAVDPSGDVLVAGRTEGNLGAPTSGPTFLRKYDPAGAVEWTRQFEGLATNLAVDGDGNALLAGRTPTVNPAVLIVKVDGDGEELWSLDFGGPTIEAEAFGIAVDAAGDAYVSGIAEGDLFEPSGGMVDAFTARLSGGSCYPDCDGSSVLDIFDFICFQDAFAIGAAYADCDGSTSLDIFDFICFQDAFVSGCP